MLKVNCLTSQESEEKVSEFFPPTVKEKLGNVDKSLGKIRESFVEQKILEKVSNLQ